MRSILNINKLVLYTLMLTFFVCCNDIDEVNEDGAVRSSVYGTVSDYATGAPISNANVTLLPGGETTLTGYDGMYEFIGISEGKYSISVSKAEYSDISGDSYFQVSKGRRVRRDLQLQKLPPFLRITDLLGNNISSLDFGSDRYVTNKSFNIFNDSSQSVCCSIYYSSQWIISISAISEKLLPGQNVTVNIQIDRSKLYPGRNTTDIIIVSENGNNMISISAIG